MTSLIQNNKKEVKLFLEANKNSLPKIAVRETLKKLETIKNRYDLFSNIIFRELNLN